MRPALYALSLCLFACQAAPTILPGISPSTPSRPLPASATPEPQTASPLKTSATVSPGTASARPVASVRPAAIATPIATPSATSDIQPTQVLPPENGCRPLPATGNLVRNPDFESPSVLKTGYQVTGQSFESWKIENGSVEIAASLWHAGSGVQSLDLDGSRQTGSLSQVMATQPGQSYQLSFCLAGNPDGQPRVKQLEVFWQNRSLARLSFDTQGHDRINMGWVTQTIVVPGSWTQADTTQLRFVSRNPAGGSWGAVIDALAVELRP